MNEFSVQIKQPVIITGNFDEMRAELQNMMQAYAGLEVTEDNLLERKKDIATLRKIRTAIEDKRKAAKKDYEKPFKKFEQECKSLTGIIDGEIDRLNADLNIFEQKRIAQKRKEVENLYTANIGEWAAYLPLESIRSPQWDNKTCTAKDIVADIQTQIINVRGDLELIEAHCGEWAEECKAVYMGSGNDLKSALSRAKDLQTAKEAAEARLKGDEQQTPAHIPETPEKPHTRLRTATEWTFTVYNKEDADFIRLSLESASIMYEEKTCQN